MDSNEFPQLNPKNNISYHFALPLLLYDFYIGSI